MNTSLDSLFQKAVSNPVALALAVMAFLVLLMLFTNRWILRSVFTSIIPKLNETWSGEIAAERQANAQRAEADRQLFRDIHDEHVRTAAARHGEVIGRFDRLDGKLDQLASKTARPPETKP